MEARLAGHYRLWMWLLLLPTLGVGTLGLWAWSRRWPQAVEEDGLRLRSGRFIRWDAIKGLGLVRRHSSLDSEVIRMDIHFNGSVAKVPVRHLENGGAIAQEVRAHAPHLKRH